MANFSVDLPDMTSGGLDWTGASRGTVADSSRASAIKSAGELFSGVVQTIDSGIESYTKEKIYDFVEKTRDQAGVGAASDIASSLPKDLERGVEGIKNLEKAKAAGNMSDTAYWAKLSSETKALRSRFPGYREHIDQTVSKVAGANPQNALRAALANEVGRGDPIAKRRQELDNKALTMEGGAEVALEVRAMERASGKTVSNEQYFLMMAKAGAKKQSIQAEKAQLELDAAGDKNLSVNVKRYASTAVDANVNGYMRQVLSPIQLDGVLNSSTSGDPEAVKQGMILLNKAEAGINTDVDSTLNEQFGNRGSLRSVINNDKDIEDIRNTQLSRIRSLRQALVDKDVGAMSAWKQFYEIDRDKAASDLLKDKYFRGLQAMRTVGGDVVANNFVNSTLDVFKEKVKSTDNLPSRLSTGRVAAGENFKDVIQDYEKMPWQKRSGFIGDLFDNIVSGAGGSKVTSEELRPVAKSLFAGGGNNFLADEKIPYEQRQKFLATATSPEFSKKMKEMGGKEYSDYTSWVANSFGVLTQKDAEAAKAIRFSNSQTTVIYDSSTTSLRVQQKTNNNAGSFLDTLADETPSQAKAVVDRLNTNIQNIVRMGKAAGVSEEGINNSVLRSLSKAGFDPYSEEERPGRVSSVFSAIGKSIQDTLVSKPDQRIPSQLKGKVFVRPDLLAGNANLAFLNANTEFLDNSGRLFDAMPKELRDEVQIISMVRSVEEQQALINSGNPRAADPRKSRHVQGDAFDIGPRNSKGPKYYAALQWLQINAPQYGVENPERIRTWDPNHFQLIRTSKSTPVPMARRGIVDQR